ncbi:hypothetical protein PV761_03160 [Arthrobacter sp. CC3]|uniref:hypothetical protein n=1 Tax=Arthrobacter sp. CC3 TaxID=3029185 RepID=UPI00326366F1
MAVETTALGFKKPDGNELVKGGDNIIAHNAQKSQELIEDLQSRFPSHFDGGTPDSVYAAEQTIDGGTV